MEWIFCVHVLKIILLEMIKSLVPTLVASRQPPATVSTAPVDVKMAWDSIWPTSTVTTVASWVQRLSQCPRLQRLPQLQQLPTQPGFHHGPLAWLPQLQWHPAWLPVWVPIQPMVIGLRHSSWSCHSSSLVRCNQDYSSRWHHHLPEHWTSSSS